MLDFIPSIISSFLPSFLPGGNRRRDSNMNWSDKNGGNSTSQHPNHHQEEEEEGEGPPASTGRRVIHFSRVPPGKLFAYRHTEDAHTVYTSHTHTHTHTHTWGKGRISMMCETHTLDQFSSQRKTSRRLVVNKHSSWCQRGRPPGTNRPTRLPWRYHRTSIQNTPSTGWWLAGGRSRLRFSQI